ncbi:MAG: MFS transporter [Muribaculaceae bacterium]|nr:MFS transporter [Muribaculaceae bacterium]MDE7394163.1 MFS transporter [Muribaculaceae bacterium]
MPDNSTPAQGRYRHPWSWVPTLYFAEGMPNAIVTTMAVLMYKNLGISNAQIAFFTSLIYLAWVIKPFWSPFVDIFGTKRRWIVTMQIAMGGCFLAVAMFLLLKSFLVPTLIALGALAFLSATHDIAADGFYMLGLSERQQSYFVGVRSAFYRLSTVAAIAGGPFLSGLLINRGMSAANSWITVFCIVAALFAVMSFYHQLILPRPAADHGAPNSNLSLVGKEFLRSFGTFFAKPGIWIALLFMLFYRLPESLLVKMITPFLVDPAEAGGLAMTNAQVGTVYGIIGVVGLLLGGIIGGWLISHYGLRRCILPMALGMSLSCGTFLLLSYIANPALLLVNACVFVEQFGYGFGFSAYMLYLVYYARGEFATSHYAIATGIMALGLMLPGMAAGLLQQWLGYQHFFWLTMVLCAVTIGVTLLVRPSIAADFGRKANTNGQ